MILRQKLRMVIFGTDTKPGKLFDIVLLWVILASMLAVMLDSVPSIQVHYPNAFLIAEWIFTILFLIEYILRIWVAKRPVKYVTSFWGVIDLLSFLPTFISLVLVGVHYLVIIRALRLLRIFRVLKLTRFMNESVKLAGAIRASFRKIIIFLAFVSILVIIMGTLMYVVEGETNGFKSIPESIYWAIVTITTVGYGDITPHTIMGKIISSLSMLIGYAIIAIPTGIVTVEIAKADNNRNILCYKCGEKVSDEDNFCKNCGNGLKH